MVIWYIVVNPEVLKDGPMREEGERKERRYTEIRFFCDVRLGYNFWIYVRAPEPPPELAGVGCARYV